MPAVLGAVAAASVAYEAGLRPATRSSRSTKSPILGFTELRKKTLLSAKGQVLHFQVKRPGHEGLINLDVQPRREATADAPTIGIVPSDSLEIGDFQAPPGMVDAPTTYQALEGKERESKVDVLVAAGPVGEEPVRLNTIVDYDRLLARYADRPIKHVIERRPILPSGDHGSPIEQFELILPINHFLDFGLRMEIEPINGIRKDSPAETAGFRKGDRIVKVNGQDFDPMRLPGICYRKCRQTDDLRGRARRRGRQTADGGADRDPRRHSPADQVCRAGRRAGRRGRLSAFPIRSGPMSSRSGPTRQRPRPASSRAT